MLGFLSSLHSFAFGTVGSPLADRADSVEVSVFVNPCLGDVRRDESGAPVVCNPMGIECSEDPCDSSWSEGEGDDSLSRFYYNPVEGDCYPFKYKGRKGNENNFLTKKLCQEKCQPISTVCFGGELPLSSPSGRVVQCHNEPCPDSYYCHVGKDDKSTVCCEKKGDLSYIFF
ncbi:Kunitz/Bovine pancreatic trypsin inhibitor domain protein [Cooperia oncophora]